MSSSAAAAGSTSGLARQPLVAVAEPIGQFEKWMQDALDAGVAQPNAMSLATCSAEGNASVRMVLLKGVDERGFRFYTNYASKKAKQAEESGRAALVFYWEALHRQVRVEGLVARLSSEESDSYFASRPRPSQINARASLQSQPMQDAGDMERRVAEETAAHMDGEGKELPVPRPEGWGGYCVTPLAVEFWQGSVTRLHERLQYSRASEAAAWTTKFLQP